MRVTWTRCLFLAFLSIGVILPILFVFGFAEADETRPVQSQVLNIAHRGASGLAPEHTMVAYHLALEQGADALELDIQMTKDGELILMHDESVDRTTDGQGFVKNLTYQEISVLDAGSWFNKKHPTKSNPLYEGLTVPKLADVFQVFGEDTRYYLEIKSPDEYPGMEEKLLALIEKSQLEDRVVIQSFSPESLKNIRAINKRIPLVQLMKKPSKGKKADLELDEIKKYADGVGTNYTRTHAEYVQKAREQGLMIQPYTVNKEKEMKKFIDWGVTGVFTNYPGRLEGLRSQDGSTGN